MLFQCPKYQTTNQISTNEKKTEKVLGEGIAYLGLLMRIWEFDGLKGNDKA